MYNIIINLENVTNQENTLKAIYETKTLKFKKTACYDKEGNLIQIFMNNADAARHMKVKPQSIQTAIKKGYCSCGFYWKNIEDWVSGSTTISKRVKSLKCLTFGKMKI